MVPVTTYLPSDYPFIAIPAFGSGDGIIFDTPGDWSEIQTITINVPTSDIPSSDVPTSEIDQITLILTGAFILIPIAAGLGLLIYIGKRKLSD